MTRIVWGAWTLAIAVGTFVAGGAVERRMDDATRVELRHLGERIDALQPAGLPTLGRLSCTAAGDGETLRSELQRALHELDGRRGAPEPREPAPAAPSAENEAALDRGRELVSAALSARKWGPEQAQAMRLLLAQVTPEGRDELLRQLMPAFNSGQIALQMHGSPF
jgi:hypothetical protein